MVNKAEERDAHAVKTPRCKPAQSVIDSVVADERRMWGRSRHFRHAPLLRYQ